MVMDFKVLKQAMHQVLDQFDHAMVLCANDPCSVGLFSMAATNGKPQRVLLLSGNLTAEYFAQYAAREIQAVLDGMQSKATVTHVRVWETATSYADWRIE